MARLLWQNKIIYFLVILSNGFLLGMLPQQAYSAGEAAMYLRAPLGAAGFAMGGAQTACPQYMCSWWNPAALSFIKGRQLTLGTGLKSLGRVEGFTALEFTVPPRAALGLSLVYRGDPYLNNLRDAQENKLEAASFTTASIKIGLSYYVNRSLSAGINSTIFYQRLPTWYINSSVQYSSSTSIGGFDVGVSYKIRENFRLGATIQNLLVISSWEISSIYMLNIAVHDTLSAPITIGGCFQTTLGGKELSLNCDLATYAFNSKMKPLQHAKIVFCTGAQWRRWETFLIRGGIGQIAFNSDIFSDRKRYLEGFTLQLTAGFFADLSKYAKGLGMNYCIATDKVWAFVDQQIDFSYKF